MAPIALWGCECGRVVARDVCRCHRRGLGRNSDNQRLRLMRYGSRYLSIVTERRSYSWPMMAAIVMLLAAIVEVFRYIPIVSDYAFWVVAANYLLLVGITK